MQKLKLQRSKLHDADLSFTCMTPLRTVRKDHTVKVELNSTNTNISSNKVKQALMKEEKLRANRLSVASSTA